MRDRLIELINNYPCMSTAEDCFIESISSDLADYLLANGVIVPPCKVGQKLYTTNITRTYVREWTVTHFETYKGDTMIYAKMSFHEEPIFLCSNIDIGDDVFFTKEEAERALKGGEG